MDSVIVVKISCLSTFYGLFVNLFNMLKRIGVTIQRPFDTIPRGVVQRRPYMTTRLRCQYVLALHEVIKTIRDEYGQLRSPPR